MEYLLLVVSFAIVLSGALLFTNAVEWLGHVRVLGVALDAHGPTLERDLLFFLAFFALAGALAWGPPFGVRLPLGILFVCAYLFYVRRTLASSGEVQGEETLDPLYF